MKDIIVNFEGAEEALEVQGEAPHVNESRSHYMLLGQYLWSVLLICRSEILGKYKVKVG